MPMLGLTGKPNVGKSTFFSASTLVSVAIANYPFTTKTANIGISYVRVPCVCKEFNVQDNPSNSLCLNGVRLVPVKMIDCPGLVPGAWQGRGLGNKFLDEVRRADSLLLVVDASGSTDMEGRPVDRGSFDPTEDVRFLEKEFDMWLAEIIRKDWDRMARTVESTHESLVVPLEEKLAGLQITRHHIADAMGKLDLDKKKPTAWSSEDFEAFTHTLRKTCKPILIVANKIDMPEAQGNVERLKMLGYDVVACSAESELILRLAAEKKLINYTPGDADFEITNPNVLNEKQRNALAAVRERVLKPYNSTGVQPAVNHAFFQLLNMIAVYPVEDVEKMSDHKGRVLPDCYLVPYGTTAREFGSLIHTELGESFIYAIEVRSRRRVGEDYVLQNKDVIKIVAGKRRG